MYFKFGTSDIKNSVHKSLKDSGNKVKRKDVNAVVDKLAEVIFKCLKNGDTVDINGLGTFIIDPHVSGKHRVEYIPYEELHRGND